MTFNKRRKAKSESEGGDDRHVSVIGDVSGFAVSAVSAVILPDINEMELTASDISPVSVAVSAVSLNEKEGQSSEVPVEYIRSMSDQVQAEKQSTI